MGRRIFTPEQIARLLRNPHVASCSPKAIGYSSTFKVSAVKQYESGLPPVMIFSEAGFDINVIGVKTPKWCIKRWHDITKSLGYEQLSNDRRGKKPGGGRPRIKTMTVEQRIERLEAENAYLKAENDFLAKLRARRKS